MTNLTKQNIIIFLSLPHEYDDENREFRFEKASFDDFNFISEVKIRDEHNKNCIYLKDLPFNYFHSTNSFKKEVTLEHFKKPIFINSTDRSSTLFYNHSQIKEENEEDLLFFKNVLAYREIIKYLENDFNSDGGLVDFFSSSKKSIFLTSTKDARKIDLKYLPSGTIDLDNSKDIKASLNNFISRLETDKDVKSKQYILFLKSTIINKLTGVSSESRLRYLLINLEEILKEAETNLNIFLHDLSLDKLKSEYRKYKVQYFNNQNEVSSKISNQVIALPFTIAALAFAMFKLENQLIPLISIGLGLLGMVSYFSYLASIYRNDIALLQNQAKRDFEDLMKESFFLNERVNSKEKEYFIEVNIELQERMKNLFNTLRLYVILLWLTSLSLLIYLIYQFGLEINLVQAILIFSLVMVLLGFLFEKVVFKNKFVKNEYK